LEEKLIVIIHYNDTENATQFQRDTQSPVKKIRIRAPRQFLILALKLQSFSHRRIEHGDFIGEKATIHWDIP
jgi:hypothetical protein